LTCFSHTNIHTASPSHRLTLFYLANDVIQNSKKKGITFFVDGFEELLPKCMGLLMDDKIRNNVLRVLTIWSERSIYRQSFIDELKSAVPYAETVSNESSATTKIMAEFKMRDLIDAVSRLQSLENETQTKTDEVKGAKLAAMGSDILSHLKDKTVGDHLIREADDAIRLLQDAIAAMEREQKQRQNLIECLNKALIYSVVQNSEVDDEFQAFIRIGQNAAKVLTVLTTPRSSSAPFLPHPSEVPSPTNSDDGPVLPSDPLPAKHTSSLDKRLETILLGAGPDVPAAAGYPGSAPYQPDQVMESMSQIRSAPAGASRITPQPIQSLVSSRPGISQTGQAIPGIMTSSSSTAPGFVTAENCEPSDMDITNSDEEEYVPGPRPGPGPNLRMIEPVRSIPNYAPDDRRMPDPQVPYLSKSRSRESADNGAWHRIPPGERPMAGRSPHSFTSPPNAGHRYIPPTSRQDRRDQTGRQGGRRSGNFSRHH
jgi:hypothetical protein